MSEKGKKKFQRNQIYQLNIDSVHPDPNQARKYFDQDALDELTNSIKKHGLLQPIIFREDGRGDVILISGERRLRAAQNAGFKEIPGITVDGNPTEIALVENLIRQDLTAVEEAEALQRLVDEHNYKHEQVAEAIGKARPTITAILSINRLPDEIKEQCRNDGRFARRELIRIAKEKSEKKMVSEFEKYKKRIANPVNGRRSRSKNKPKQAVIKCSLQDIIKKLEKVGPDLMADDGLDITEELLTLRMLIDEIMKCNYIEN